MGNHNEYLNETIAMCMRLRWCVAYKKIGLPFFVSELLPFDELFSSPEPKAQCELL